MAYSTLQELRERLNADLAIDDGSTAPWGDQQWRSDAIRRAFERLAPEMMRLVQETVTLLADTYSYDLASVRDVELIEYLDSTGRVIDDVKNYRAWLVQDDPVVCRLRFARPLDITGSLVVTGYTPYSSDLTSDLAQCDLEQRYEWIALVGARAELYRRRFHEWMDYEQYNADNPSTVIDANTLFQAYQDTVREFEQAKNDHRTQVSIPRTARLRR